MIKFHPRIVIIIISEENFATALDAEKLFQWSRNTVHNRCPNDLNHVERPASIAWLGISNFFLKLKDLCSKNYRKYVIKGDNTNDACRLSNAHSETICQGVINWHKPIINTGTTAL